ncbi:type II toxin-antitoxin system HicB family antitoxin [Clostridium botulinum]|uniref:type II toxin-antitoxin system HicB family antitoxin n=1 Tax=Clostridium botulinum TaxID=1491 RepID=UPI000773AA93|nr:type II toxin-antitoxin system HicB family antitoxin [Clostridium botulinum]
MSKYLYFAIFTECDNKGYIIKFPDFDEYVIKADTIEDGLKKSKQALEICLFNLLKDGQSIPNATVINDITLIEGQFLIPIKAYEKEMDILKQQNYQTTKKTKSKFKSSTILLEHLTKEYDKEDSRSMKIDSRIPIFITIATFLGGFIFNIGFESLKNIYDLGQKVYSIYIIIHALCIISIVISIGIFGWILFTKKYKRIETSLFLSKEINKEEIEKTAYELMKGYQDSLQNNIKVNDKKIQLYNTAIIFVAIGAVLYIILKFISFLIK